MTMTDFLSLPSPSSELHIIHNTYKNQSASSTWAQRSGLTDSGVGLNLNLCQSEGGIQSCGCTRINKEVKPPFNPLFIVRSCFPKECTCKSGKKEPVRDFGCSNGGIPGCGPNGESTKDPRELSCLDGTVISNGMIVKSVRNNRCVCDDNSLPVCTNTKQPPVCPGDSSQPSVALASVNSRFISFCNA
ncbi:unnamed protein product [Lepeophtheirus salmonis]|uniref:(salmon louse) hypothetical protein n=1 Tax=Lepeophtheirus salmonis TaxID=72036 RepID=A0A7R8HCN8_LEPSM|nr:unnamed protein product [Lepeophtheirus salmonis]CAF3019623.1 unnamed protein product [Lepeophtheirus salmonis]